MMIKMMMMMVMLIIVAEHVNYPLVRVKVMRRLRLRHWLKTFPTASPFHHLQYHWCFISFVFPPLLLSCFSIPYLHLCENCSSLTISLVMVIVVTICLPYPHHFSKKFSFPIPLSHHILIVLK